jgi:uncharacterized LabA/DUF88 family protein
LTKIAIYGDSFAADYNGWPKTLQKLLNVDVVTFGVDGTSIDYSYLKFLETHEKYDVIIFLWSNSLRTSLVSTSSTHNYSTLKHYTSVFLNLNDLESVEYHQKLNKLYPNEFQKLNKEVLFWIKSQKITSDNFMHTNLLSQLSMRDSVKLKRPESINIECFDLPKVNKTTLNYKNIIPGLYRVQAKDMCQFTDIVSTDRVEEDVNIRLNHLTKIQNQELAQYISYALNDKDFDIHKTFEKPEKHYTMSKTLEESGFLI